MRDNKLIAGVWIFLMVFAFSACREGSDDPAQDTNKFLVESEYRISLPKPIIQIAISKLEVQYPEAVGLNGKVESGVNVYKITYKTTFQEAELIASGLVVVPSLPGSYPLLSFQNGTNVLYSEAPSKVFDAPLTETSLQNTIVMLGSLASLGFVVIIPDYPGFGSSESVFHPYLEKANTLPALVDMISATSEFFNANELAQQLNGDLFLAGYSQGGWSTMQLLKALDQNPLDGFKLKAASCGAGPYKLDRISELVLAQEAYPMPYYFAYILHAYKLHGLITNSLADLFNEPYASSIPNLFDFQTSGGQINATLTENVVSLFSDDYLLGFSDNPNFSSVKAALKMNSISAWDLHTPTKLFHGEEDVYIPVTVSEELLADFRAKGVGESQIGLTVIPGANHSTGVLPFALQTIGWFSDLRNN